MRRALSIALKPAVNYPLETSLFDDNDSEAIHTSTEGGDDEG